MDKLTWFNGEYIRKLPFDEYLKMVTPWFDKALGGKHFDYKRLAEPDAGPHRGVQPCARYGALPG